MGLGGEAGYLKKQARQWADEPSSPSGEAIFWGLMLGTLPGFLVCGLLHYTVIDPELSFVFPLEFCPCDVTILVISVVTSIIALYALFLSNRVLPAIIAAIIVIGLGVAFIIFSGQWNNQMKEYKKVKAEMEAYSKEIQNNNGGYYYDDESFDNYYYEDDYVDDLPY